MVNMFVINVSHLIHHKYYHCIVNRNCYCVHAENQGTLLRSPLVNSPWAACISANFQIP